LEADRAAGGRELLPFRRAEGRAEPGRGIPELRRLGEWIDAAGEVGCDDAAVDGPADESIESRGRSRPGLPRSVAESSLLEGRSAGLGTPEPEVAEDWEAELSPEAVLLVLLSWLNSPEAMRDGPRGEGTGDESTLRSGPRDGCLGGWSDMKASAGTSTRPSDPTGPVAGEPGVDGTASYAGEGPHSRPMTVGSGRCSASAMLLSSVDDAIRERGAWEGAAMLRPRLIPSTEAER